MLRTALINLANDRDDLIGRTTLQQTSNRPAGYRRKNRDDAFQAGAEVLQQIERQGGTEGEGSGGQAGDVEVAGIIRD